MKAFGLVGICKCIEGYIFIGCLSPPAGECADYFYETPQAHLTAMDGGNAEKMSGTFSALWALPSSNNVHVKPPVRHPCLSLEEYHFVIPRPVTEARSRIYTC